jgi:hypothetical protein
MRQFSHGSQSASRDLSLDLQNSTSLRRRSLLRVYVVIGFLFSVLEWGETASTWYAGL